MGELCRNARSLRVSLVRMVPIWPNSSSSPNTPDVGLEWQQYVAIAPRSFRPLEVEALVADTSKARAQLAWSPKVTFKELARIIVDADLEMAGVKFPGAGEKIMQERFGHWHRWSNTVSPTLKQAAERVWE
jgi:hypothetical protein